MDTETELNYEIRTTHPKVLEMFRMNRNLMNPETKGGNVTNCQKLLYEGGFGKIGRFGTFEKTGNEGVLTVDGKWDDINRLNTYTPLIKTLMSQVLYEDETFFDLMYKNIYSNIYIKKNFYYFWEYLRDNFKLFFTTEITDVYYNYIYDTLRESWCSGNFTSVCTILSFLKNYGDNILRMEYDFSTGNNDDMRKGIDLEVFFKNGDHKKYQIKRLHRMFSNNNEVHFNTSQMATIYNKDIIFALTKYHENTGEISMNLVKNDFLQIDTYNIQVSRKKIILMDNYIDETAKLIHEMVIFSKIYELKFTIVTEGENELTLQGDELTLDFSNPTDKKSILELNDKFEKVKSIIYQQV